MNSNFAGYLSARQGLLLACFILCSSAMLFGQKPTSECQIGVATSGNAICNNRLCSGLTDFTPTPSFIGGAGYQLSGEYPCDCLYVGGCTVSKNVARYLGEDHPELYGSRPMMFVGCNGAMLLAIPLRRRNDAGAAREGY